VLARYADPHSLIRLGHARLTRFLIRHSRGGWREHHATMLLTAAQESLQLWAKFKRLMIAERHHDSAICHIANILLTRIATCWRTGEHYVLRDTDGRRITPEEGRRIVRTHQTVDKDPHQRRLQALFPTPQR
jgi:hypothetical protein